MKRAMRSRVESSSCAAVAAVFEGLEARVHLAATLEDATGVPLAATAAADGVHVMAGDESGLIALHGAGGEWDGSRPKGAQGTPLLYTDTRDGRVYAVVNGADGGLSWMVRGESGEFEPLGALTLPGGERFHGFNLTTFTSADGRVHVVGSLVGSFDLAILYQNQGAAPDDPANWSFANLSLILHGSGQGVATFTGAITAWATPWGGMHIAAADQYSVTAVWWAPGVPTWQRSELVSLRPPRSGPAVLGISTIASMVTPWGGVSLVVPRAQSDGMVSVWWAPGLSEWKADDLYDPDAGVRLGDRYETMVTEWGGMTIAARDLDTGSVAVLWWAPGMDRWTVTRVEPVGVGGEAVAPPALTFGSMRGLGQPRAMDIFAQRESDGHILRFFWEADSAVWMLEDLTERVT